MGKQFPKQLSPRVFAAPLPPTLSSIIRTTTLYLNNTTSETKAQIDMHVPLFHLLCPTTDASYDTRVIGGGADGFSAGTKEWRLPHPVAHN